MEKWNEKYDDTIASFTDVMQEFSRKGIDEVYIQPITFVADQCYQQMRKQALSFYIAMNIIFSS